MITDSENNMMNQTFSLHTLGGRRFFLFILLLINFQIIQAVCIHNEAPLSDSTSTFIVVSEGTIISGMEQVHVSQPKKEKIEKTFKRKNFTASNKRNQKKEKIFPQRVENSPKAVPIFIRNTPSEKSLLAISDHDKQIVSPNQHTLKYLLFGSENKTPVLVHLLDIFLKKTHKDQWFSNLTFFRNFNRPPPFIKRATA
ncbi:hypothetical protein M2347_003141 [Chryseobacterium sp. H1D6B]|uniref:hypothetical protein n=1 Tax=Chryseobacterium sp. H1D6B TaxID=2940588 RepID=UPI0015CBEACE|nr:hypothetical protein [Chryseobacterium sp. H1D6B]MDH6253414.1 hypothetical protein [Chryseobacterium sp. H1D6B]